MGRPRDWPRPQSRIAAVQTLARPAASFPGPLWRPPGQGTDRRILHRCEQCHQRRGNGRAEQALAQT
eukprot:5007461-Alexandrium_andersonii.AAC.1